MKAGFVQFRPAFGAVGDNVAAMCGHIRNNPADLMVLPELATTGYTFSTREELAKIAEPFESSPSLDTLQAAAREMSCAVVAGFAEREGDTLFNSAALLRPDGSRELYRKIHLYGAENLFFTPGDIPFRVYEAGGAKIGIMICFDWFYPESARVLSVLGAEIICHPVNFVLPWGQHSMVTQSIQNHVYVVTANRYGTEKNGPYSFTFTGASQITGTDGTVLASAPKEGDKVKVVDLDPSKASDKRINKYNDLFKGRRIEFYQPLTDSAET